MKKICFVGGPGSGKSTLAREIVNKLGLLGYNVEYVDEYARKHIRETGRPCCIFEQYFIQDKQVEKEDYVARQNCDFIICDSASILSYAYAIRYQGRHSILKRRKVLQEILDKAHEQVATYDLIFFIPQEISCEEDGVRFNIEDARDISEQIEAFLKVEMISFYVLTGTLEQRSEKALETIKEKARK